MLANLCRHIVYAREFAGELEDLMATFKDMCLRLHKEHRVSAEGNPLPGEDAIGSARRTIE